MELHHIVPKAKGGNDKYDNLVFITKEAHKLIHATTEDQMLELTKQSLDKVNKLRVKAGNKVLV